MAITLATKFSPKFQQLFSKESQTDKFFSDETQEFVGADQVKITVWTTKALVDYTMSGSSRFGTPTEAENTVQTLTLTQDKADSTVFDDAVLEGQPVVALAANWVKRYTNEQVIRTVDKYRLGIVAASAIANGFTKTTATTSTNAYDHFLLAQASLDNNEVPDVNRVAWVTSDFYSKLKANILSGGGNAEQIVNGIKGYCDGVPLIVVASGKMPTDVSLIMGQKESMHRAVKLKTLNINKQAVGYGATVVEIRIRHDAWIFDHLKGGVYAHKEA